MKTQLMTFLAFGLLQGAGAGLADDQPDAKAVLDKAVKAMNGEAKLAKLNTVSAKAKITGNSDGNQDLTLDIDGTWQGPSQYRADVEVQHGGKGFKAVLVVRGDKGWFKRDDKTEDAPEGTVTFLQNIFYAGRMPQLLPALRDKAYKLSPLGEVKVGAQAAVGISISHNDRKDVSLFFDKDAGLPLKSEVRLDDPKGKEVTLEYLYSDYKDFSGVKLPSKIMIKFNNMDFTMELSEIKATEKVEDGRFDRP